MGRYAVIDKASRKVLNVIVWDGRSEITGLTDNPNILLVETETGNVGDIYDVETKSFIKPEDIIVERILSSNDEMPPSEVYKIFEGGV